jgi:phospho-N-acetylmuramoyl-pentapeptide-transferase
LWDDWVKLTDKTRKRGITKREKQGALTLLALLVGLWLLVPAGLQHEMGGPHLYVPFVKDFSIDLAVWFGVPFLLVAIAVLTGSANAVNLTDGLDGLATGCVVTAAIAYAVITYAVGRVDWAQYLLVPHVAGATEMTVMMAALLGGSLGFLWFNAAPAMVFMGDVGSLGLGGALGYAALVSRTELVLLVVGGVFVVEALSVILQVASFKLRGKRIFKCAPLHHHFQFGGMPETRVVVRTWVVSALLALCSLALFKVR